MPLSVLCCFSLYVGKMFSFHLFDFMMVHSYLTLAVRQFALLFSFVFFGQCRYNLFTGTVFSLISHTVVAIITLSTTYHFVFCHVLLLVTVTFFAGEFQVICIIAT